MHRSIVLCASLALVVLACVRAPIPPIQISARSRAVSYSEDVEPILDRRCVTCHSCYNAACQLQLSSYEGIDRGGSKQQVYSSSRLRAAPPTRLFFDAENTAGWRALGFHSVTESKAEGRLNDSVMLHLLAAKRRQPIPDGDYRAEGAGLSCPSDAREVGEFLTRHPGRGMPFGLPAISEAEYQTLASWLSAGAPGPDPEDQARRSTPSAKNRPHVEKWESFLNQPDAKHAMTARYLYEHFFLAHVAFTDGDPTEFFELVRSSTPPGSPIEVIATVRPYDDPGVERFFYRLRKIRTTIVYKTHIVLEWDDAALARYRELFIEPEWLEPPHVKLFDDKQSANPFVIYAQIPPDSRYRFLLDHSEFMLRTFIRGPVCWGQVALNVIHDHFWVMFLDPEADATVKHPEFLQAQASNLRLPTEQGSEKRVLETFSNRYRERYVKFFDAKMKLYDRESPEGFDIEAIWKGRRASDAPMLTVYRHFDSASVHKGAVGGLPRTLWVIDYPQLERIYYALVAGFDVFGNVSHQVNVRRYMDYLRMEGELNFLQFMPPAIRGSILESWYLGDRAIENTARDQVLTERETRVTFETDDPKKELVERVVNSHLLPAAGIGFDDINYHGNRPPIPMPERFETHEDIMDGLRALTAPGTAFIRYHNETAVNLLWMRVRDYQGEDHFISLVINRWHDNVNSMFGEAETLDPSKDTLDFVDGVVGQYPNFFFDVAGKDVPAFFDMLANFDGSDAYVEKLDYFGVNRSEPRFWEDFDWFQAEIEAADPLRAGIIDVTRYYPRTE